MTESVVQVLLVFHLLFTAAMAGLIWFVQVVHYPLFACVGDAAFPRYERAHVKRTTFVVAPLMIIELVLTAGLLFAGIEGGRQVMVVACAGLLAINWLSTAMLQVPCHRLLEDGLELIAQRRLVRTNWIRTSAWTAKSILATLLLT